MEQEDRVKLTVMVPRSLWKAAKMRAVEHERDLRDLVIEGLEWVLSRKEVPRKAGRIEMRARRKATLR